MKKTLTNAVILITVFAVATRMLGFVFKIILSRILQPEALGVYQVALSFFGVLLTIISSGLPIAISKETSKASDDKKSIMQCATAGVVISLVASIILCGIVFLLNQFFKFLFPNEFALKILIILLPAVVASSVYSALRGVWWGQKKFFLLGFSELLEQIIRVVFFIILASSFFGIVNKSMVAGISLSAACVVSAILVLVVFLKQGGKLKSGKGYYKPLLKSAVPITGMRTISSLVQPLISVIIPLRLIAAGFSQSQALAQYGIAVGMTLPLLFLPSMLVGSLATALVPELSQAVQKKDHDQVTAKISSAIKFTLLISFVLIPLFIGLGPQIGTFLYGNVTSGKYLREAAWIMVPLSLSLITNSILNSLGLEIASAKHYLVGAVFLLACIWFLPTYIGISALAIGMGICMSIASVLSIQLIKKKVPKTNGLLRYFFSLSGITVASSLLATWSYGTLIHIVGSFMSLLIAGTLTLTAVFSLALVCNLINLSTLTARFNKKKVRIKTT